MTSAPDDMAEHAVPPYGPAPSLLVVDATSAGKDLVDGFRARGYRVLHVDAIDAALVLARQVPLAMVVTELRLQPGCGFELLERLKDLDRQFTVVVATAFGSVDSALYAVKLGARDFLCKPVTASQVLAAGGIQSNEHGHVIEEDGWRTLDGASEQYIRETLDHFGSVTKAAQVLGVDRRSLRRRMTRYARSRA